MSGQQTTAYETCEIKWKRTLSWPIYQFKFYAEAIGQRGMYTAGESKAITNSPSPNGFGGGPLKKAQPVLQAFVSQLTADGWEPVSVKGVEWYSYRFRRRVRG